MREPEPRALLQPTAFRSALLCLPAAEREAWVDRLLGLETPLNDGTDLPRGCVPYLPCPVDALICALEQAQVGPRDVVVDVGSGLGRALVLTQLWTGARVIGVEVQAHLVALARELVTRTGLAGASLVHGDASECVRSLPTATVFFLYCPFSGERLRNLLAELEALSRSRPLRICGVCLPELHQDWLVRVTPPALAEQHGVCVYRSRQPHSLHVPAGEIVAR